MPLPLPMSEEAICVLPDGSVRDNCTLLEGNFLPPYPASPVPHSASRALSWRQDRSKAHFTIHLAAGVQGSKTEKYVPEYFLNKKPWQLFRASMTPILFDIAEHKDDDPVIPGPLPVGTVVDFIIQNTLNETVSLYKHGAPVWLLGSGAYEEFPYKSVTDAIRAGNRRLNLDNPGRVITHDLPPLGWSVIRFKVISKEVTLIHAAKLRLFAVSMKPKILDRVLLTKALLPTAWHVCAHR